MKLNNWLHHFLVGAARLLNPPSPRSDFIPVPEISDADALRSDWEAVGRYMWRAMKQVDDSLTDEQRARVRTKYDMDKVFRERNLK